MMYSDASHVKPPFSMKSFKSNLRFSRKINCQVLIYQSYADPLILNTYVVPKPFTAKNAIEEEWKSRGGIYIKKPSIKESFRINSNFQLSTNCQSTIIPEEISLTDNPDPVYFEVCIQMPGDIFEMELIVAEGRRIWKAAFRKGADYKTAMPTRSADQSGAVSLPTVCSEVCIKKPDDEFKMELIAEEVIPICSADFQMGADYQTAMPTCSADQGGAVSLPTDKLLGEIRGRFVEKVSLPLIKQLLDGLQQERVLHSEEAEAVLEEQAARADRARCLIDMVRKKGCRASGKMITLLREKDPTLVMTLGLA